VRRQQAEIIEAETGGQPALLVVLDDDRERAQVLRLGPETSGSGSSIG
jgi:hypothetical protein